VLDTNTSEYQGSRTMRVAQKVISHVFLQEIDIQKS
jgi:hypothetical protein